MLKNKIFIFIFISLFLVNCNNDDNFEKKPEYTNNLTFKDYFIGAAPKEPDNPNEISFKLYAPNAQTVNLVGTFNDWDKSADVMKKNSHGVWECLKDLPDGNYNYKYLIDGETYIPDPRCLEAAIDAENDLSSIINVGTTKSVTTHKWINNSRDLIVYILHILEFSNGLGVSGVIDKIDYIKQLGVNCVQFTIVTPTPNFGCEEKWGYQTRLWWAIKNKIGSAKDFKRLVDLLHENDISVILDVELDLAWSSIAYHEEEIFALHPDWKHPDKTYSIFQVLNVNNEELRYYMLNSCKSWIENFGVDGLRFDSIAVAGYKDAKSFYGWLVSTLKTEYPKLFFTYETGEPEFSLYNEDNILTTTEIDSSWDMHIKSLLNGSKWWDFSNPSGILFGKYYDATYNYYNIEVLKYNLQQLGMHTGGKPLMVSAGTHDEEKISVTKLNRSENYDWGPVAGNTRISDYNPEIGKLAATYIFTIPGIPMILNGNEFGDNQSINYDAPNWLSNFNIDLSLLEHYKKVILLRNTYSELRSSYISNVISYRNENCISFIRGEGTNKFVCVFNFDSQTQTIDVEFPVLGNWTELIDNEILNVTTLSNSIELAPYEGKVFKIIE